MSTWVVVEHETDVSYGPEGGQEYRSIGRVFGPFASEDEARRFTRGKKRSLYAPDLEAREIEPV